MPAGATVGGPQFFARRLRDKLLSIERFCRGSRPGRGRAEVEAESVAYVVCQAAGLTAAVSGFCYVAGWAGGDPAVVKETAGRVVACSRGILEPAELLVPVSSGEPQTDEAASRRQHRHPEHDSAAEVDPPPPSTESSASATVSAGGEVTTAGPPSSTNPVVTGIETPVAATIVISETTIDQVAPSGITFLGQQVNIDLNGATTGIDLPFVFTFSLDSVVIGESDPETFDVYRNGNVVLDCTHATHADPDPFVESRTSAGGGAVLVVRTTAASKWNFSTRTYQVDGSFAPVEMGEEINVAKAGRTIPVKFALGGDRGLDVLAPGLPSSVAVACPADSSPDDVAIVTSGGGLTYDATSDRYTWKWSTNAAWRGCRRLDVTLVDGSVLSAFFSFR